MSVLAVIAATGAAAQDAGVAATTELPPVVVEGATVEKPKVKVKPTKVDAQTAAVPGPVDTDAATGAAAGGESETVKGVPADQIGSSVTIITNAELKAQQIRHAADALRSLPGVSVSQSGSGGGLTQVRIRGAEGNHTLVLIDGIDASDGANNEFDFSNLLADDIDRIEVIRGAQSGIYGSKAIGGVINIITKGGKGPITLAARSEVGGYGTHDVQTRASGGTDQFWLSVSAGYREQNDFNWDIWGSEDDPWHQSTLNVKGGVELMKGMVLDFSLRRSNKLVNTDTDAYMPRPPMTPYNSAIDSVDSSEADIFLGGLNLRWDTLDGAFTQIAKANRNSTTSDIASELYGPSSYEGAANTYSYLATYRFASPALLGAKHSVSGMIERKDERFTPSSDYVLRERSHVATIGEYRGEFLERVFVSGTVRRDDNENFDDFTTWHSGVSIDLHEVGLRPHASTGTGVALPSMFEQFGYFTGTFVGNPNLKPEESFSWDAGVEFSLLRGRAMVDVTYFDADLTNKITTDYSNYPLTTLINLPGKSERRGIEVSARALVFSGLTVGGSYTFLDATDPNGVEEIRRPRNAGRADVNYNFDAGRANINFAAIYNGDTKDTDFVSYMPVTLDSYWLLNVGASYQLTPQLEVYGRVDNLLDERYEEILGYNTLGLAAYGGIRVSLEDPSTAAWAKYK